MVDKRTTWSANDDQFESRRRMLASRNLFEVRFIRSNIIFLSDCTATPQTMIGCWHDAVRLSVHPSVYDAVHCG